MLEESVVSETGSSEKSFSGKPTKKQLELIDKLVKELGVKKPNIGTFEEASKTIENLIAQVKPTDKQVAFAQKLSKEKGIAIPQEALSSKKGMSRWLDKILKERGDKGA